MEEEAAIHSRLFLKTKLIIKYKQMEKLVDKAIKFWKKIGKENGWVLGKRGVTVWINDDGNQVDSCYNPDNENNKSFIVHHISGEILHVIQK